MEVRRLVDPVAFFDRAAPFLAADEAAHILPLGIASMLIRHPTHAATPPYPAVVAERGVVAAVALMMPPRNLVLSRVVAPESSDALMAGPASSPPTSPTPPPTTSTRRSATGRFAYRFGP